MRKALTLLSTTALQAPDAPTSPQESGDTEVVKRQVAKHELLNAAGEVVEDEESATGIRYTLVANQQAFDFQSGLNPGERNTMLVIFGAKTLATNETSAARNNTKGSASPDEQIDAVRERFALLETGKWVDRTREGVGAKVDPDALAEAICRVIVAEGKMTQADVDAGYKAKVRAKIDDDKVYARKARTMPKVASEYSALVGRTTATTDDLMAL
jgi:hypothetical protein